MSPADRAKLEVLIDEQLKQIDLIGETTTLHWPNAEVAAAFEALIRKVKLGGEGGA